MSTPKGKRQVLGPRRVVTEEEHRKREEARREWERERRRKPQRAWKTTDGKPTRADLLEVIGRLQGLVGDAMMMHANDRDQNGFEKGQGALQQAHALCIEASSFDPPV